MSYTPYGEKTITGPDIFHQKYTGQVDDGEDSELLYYNARYYDPKLGRFISADSIISDATISQAFNRYMYVLGNPISYNDPTGHYNSDMDGRKPESGNNSSNSTETSSDNNGSNIGDVGSQLGNEGKTSPAAESTSDRNGGDHGNGVKGSLHDYNKSSMMSIQNLVNCHDNGGGFNNSSAGQINFNEMMVSFMAAVVITSVIVAAPEIAAGYTFAGQWVASRMAAITAGGGAATAVAGRSGVVNLSFTQKSFQHMFSKHASAFGVTGSWSKTTAAQFENVLNTHINSIAPIQGTYRGTQQVMHFLDTSSGLKVVSNIFRFFLKLTFNLC